MLGAYATAATLGLLLGLRYRIAAAIAASGLALPVVAVAAVLLGWSYGMALLAAFGAACILQCGYLAGLLLGHSRSRFGPGMRATDRRPGPRDTPPLGDARAPTP